MAHFMGNYAGEFVRRIRTHDQTLEHMDISTGQGDGAGLRPANHGGAQWLPRAGAGIELADETVERPPAVPAIRGCAAVERPRRGVNVRNPTDAT